MKGASGTLGSQQRIFNELGVEIGVEYTVDGIRGKICVKRLEHLFPYVGTDQVGLTEQALSLLCAKEVRATEREC